MVAKSSYLENLLASVEEVIILPEASSISGKVQYLVNLSPDAKAAILQFASSAVAIKQLLDKTVSPLSYQEIFLELTEMTELESIPGDPDTYRLK